MYYDICICFLSWSHSCIYLLFISQGFHGLKYTALNGRTSGEWRTRKRSSQSLTQPDWKKQLKVCHISSDAEIIAATETWLDRQPSELFLSVLQKLEFGRCSLFPSWSDSGLISTLVDFKFVPLYLRIYSRALLCPLIVWWLVSTVSGRSKCLLA